MRFCWPTHLLRFTLISLLCTSLLYAQSSCSLEAESDQQLYEEHHDEFALPLLYFGIAALVFLVLAAIAVTNTSDNLSLDTSALDRLISDPSWLWDTRHYAEAFNTVKAFWDLLGSEFKTWVVEYSPVLLSYMDALEMDGLALMAYLAALPPTARSVAAHDLLVHAQQMQSTPKLIPLQFEDSYQPLSLESYGCICTSYIRKSVSLRSGLMMEFPKYPATIALPYCSNQSCEEACTVARMVTLSSAAAELGGGVLGMIPLTAPTLVSLEVFPVADTCPGLPPGIWYHKEVSPWESIFLP